MKIDLTNCKTTEDVETAMKPLGEHVAAFREAFAQAFAQAFGKTDTPLVPTKTKQKARP